MSCNLVKGSSLILQINFRTVFCLIPSNCIHVYVYRKLAPDLVLYIYILKGRLGVVGCTSDS